MGRGAIALLSSYPVQQFLLIIDRGSVGSDETEPFTEPICMQHANMLLTADCWHIIDDR